MDKDKEDRLYKNLSLFPEEQRLEALALIVKGNLLREENTTELEQVTVSDNSYLFVGDNQVNTIEKGSWNYSKKSKNKNESTDYIVQPKGVYLGDAWHEKVFAPLIAKTALWSCQSNVGPLFPVHNGREWKKTFPQGAKGLGIMLKNCSNVAAGYLACNSSDLKNAKGPECVILFRKQVFEKAVEVGLIAIQQGDTEKEKEAPKEEEKKNEGANKAEVVNPFESTSQQVNQDGTFSWNQ